MQTMSIRSLAAAGLLLMAAGCAREAAPPATRAAAQAPAFRTVATVKQVMQGIVIPSSNVIFAVASEVPQDDGAWLGVENNALALAETGNLLLMDGRAVDHENWAKYARELTDAAESAAQAAHDKDAARTTAAGDAIYAVCDSCHQQYMPRK